MQGTSSARPLVASLILLVGAFVACAGSSARTPDDATGPAGGRAGQGSEAGGPAGGAEAMAGQGRGPEGFAGAPVVEGGAGGMAAPGGAAGADTGVGGSGGAAGPPEATCIPDDAASPCFRYVGRVDHKDPKAPRFYYAGLAIETRFEGTSVRGIFTDVAGHYKGHAQTIAVVVDDRPPVTVSLPRDASKQSIMLASGLPAGVHTLKIWKEIGPGGAFGWMGFHGLALDAGARVRTPAPAPARRIEVYGDSVTEGASAGCPTGMDNCGIDSAYQGYASRLGRALPAQVQNLGIGGLALLDNTGWFESGKTGLETTYDKLNPSGASKTSWDFTRFRPHLVIIGIGVNDASRNGFADLPKWKTKYKEIVRDLASRYGKKTPFILTVGAMGDWLTEAWKNVSAVADELRVEGYVTHYFKFTSQSGGKHPGSPQSQKNAEEMTNFIKGLDITWTD